MRRMLLSVACVLSISSSAIHAETTVREVMRELHQRLAAREVPAPDGRGLEYATSTGTELVQNGGFEAGWAPSGSSGDSGVSGGWTWSQTGSGLNPIWWDNNPELSSPATLSRTGSWCVYFFPFGPSTNRIYQTVSIPAGTTATLSFWLKIGTFEGTYQPVA